MVGSVCFMFNNQWCSTVEISYMDCFPNLEHDAVLTSVYIGHSHSSVHSTRHQSQPSIGVIYRTKTSRLKGCFYCGWQILRDDAISLTLSHLDQRNTYVRMLFIDYKIQHHCVLQARHESHGSGARPHPVWLDPEFPDRQTPGCVDRQHHILHPDTQHAPQGYVLSPFMYSLFMHDCVATATAPTPSLSWLTLQPSSA